MGVVRVTVISGNNLVAKDVGVFSRPSSDPYVTVRLGNQWYRTDYKTKNLNPTYNQTFTFTNVTNPATDFILFEVFDYDAVGTNDPMGNVSVPLSNLVKGVPQRMTVNLTNVRSGSLTIELVAEDFSGSSQMQMGYGGYNQPYNPTPNIGGYNVNQQPPQLQGYAPMNNNNMYPPMNPSTNTSPYPPQPIGMNTSSPYPPMGMNQPPMMNPPMNQPPMMGNTSYPTQPNYGYAPPQQGYNPPPMQTNMYSSTTTTTMPPPQNVGYMPPQQNYYQPPPQQVIVTNTYPTHHHKKNKTMKKLGKGFRKGFKVKFGKFGKKWF
ncbi:hypothetical protein ABK040_004134 [Willaertia magna]